MARRLLAVAVAAVVLVVIAAPGEGATVGFSGSVSAGAGTGFRQHTFPVTVPGPITVQLDWSSTSANLHLLLYEPSGALVAWNTSTARPKVLTYEGTVSGTWRLGVRSVTGSTAYTLVVEHATEEPTTTTVPPTGGVTSLEAVRVVGGPGHADHYGWGQDTIPPGQPGAGNVLSSDYWNERVTEFDPDGNLVSHVIPRTRPGGPPYDVAVSPTTGNIAVGNVDGGRVVDIYTRSGTHLRSCGDPQRWSYPAWLDYDDTGRLAVADSRGHRIVVISDDTCAVLFQFGSRGGGADQVNTPRGVDFGPDGTLWVNDASNRRITAWVLGATSATPLRRFPVMGADNRGLLFNRGDGLLYLVDASNATIDVYTQQGALVRRFGSRGTGPGQFVDGGRGISRDGTGAIWVGDMPNFRTQRFSPGGQHLGSAPSAASPPPPGGYNQPGGVSLMADGTIVGVDSFNWRVVLHAADGSPLRSFGTRATLNYPRGVAVDLVTGTVLVANTDGQEVVAFTPFGQRLWTAAGVKAWDLAVAPDRTIYAAEFQSGRVRIVHPDGTLGATFGAGELSDPRGIAVDPVDGSVWVANQGTARVVHFSPAGALVGSFPAPSSQLVGIAVDTHAVFVSDKQGNVVRTYDRAGVLQDTIGGGGSGLGRFRQPAGMEVLGDRLYVMETGNERIQELRIVRT